MGTPSGFLKKAGHPPDVSRMGDPERYRHMTAAEVKAELDAMSPQQLEATRKRFGAEGQARLAEAEARYAKARANILGRTLEAPGRR